MAARKRQQRSRKSSGDAVNSPSVKLTDREAHFVEEYDCGAWIGNGLRSAMAAGFSPENPNAAGVAAFHLLRKPKIVAALRERREKRGERLQFDADRILSELAVLSTTTIKDFLDADGNLRVNLADLPDDVLACVSEVTETEQFGVITTKLKLHDRTKALALAGKHKLVQAFTEKLEVNHSMSERMAAIARQMEGDSA